MLLQSLLMVARDCKLLMVLAMFLSLTGLVHAQQDSVKSAEIELGRRIYQQGILTSGEPLAGNRLEQQAVQGEAAACASCHRASGMGSVEGSIVVPPITGRFLFAEGDNRPVALLDPSAAKNVSRAHSPYTEVSLSKAIRDGLNINGQAMSPLMPRYALNEQDMHALSAYLRQLSAEVSPGVTADTLHFATIIAPGVDVKQSEVMVKMIKAAFSQRNASQETSAGRMKMPLDLLPRVARNWELAVWQLQGAPATWAQQLAEFYRQQPVFAVMSGLANSDWDVVQQFCEQRQLPCLLPSIPLVPEQESKYGFYYANGVVLEAQVLAKQFRDQADKAPKRLVQIYRDEPVGRAAAKAFSQAMQGTHLQLEDHQVKDLAELGKLVQGYQDQEQLLLWLDANDLAALKKLSLKKPPLTYLSTFMAGEAYAGFSKVWLPQLRLIYPYEFAEKRQANLNGLKRWLLTWNIPLVNEAFQSEIFFNLLFLTDVNSQLLDNFYADYYLERASDMLSRGTNSSPYPHLSLGRGQRFASKGAYIAQLDSQGKLKPASEWIVP